MSVDSTVTVVLDSGPPSSFPVVLKKIMENPPPNILEEGNEGKVEFVCVFWAGLNARVDVWKDLNGAEFLFPNDIYGLFRIVQLVLSDLSNLVRRVSK